MVGVDFLGRGERLPPSSKQRVMRKASRGDSRLVDQIFCQCARGNPQHTSTNERQKSGLVECRSSHG